MDQSQEESVGGLVSRDVEPDTPPSLSVIVQDSNHNRTTTEPWHGTNLVSQNHIIARFPLRFSIIEVQCTKHM